MSLPFLKKRRVSRAASAPREEKQYGLSSDEELDMQLIEELMEAVKNKDSALFTRSLEAFIMNCFESGDL